jgi:hypothetical protein
METQIFVAFGKRVISVGEADNVHFERGFT